MKQQITLEVDGKQFMKSERETKLLIKTVQVAVLFSFVLVRK